MDKGGKVFSFSEFLCYALKEMASASDRSAVAVIERVDVFHPHLKRFFDENCYSYPFSRPRFLEMGGYCYSGDVTRAKNTLFPSDVFYRLRPWDGNIYIRVLPDLEEDAGEYKEGLFSAYPEMEDAFYSFVEHLREISREV